MGKKIIRKTIVMSVVSVAFSLVLARSAVIAYFSGDSDLKSGLMQFLTGTVKIAFQGGPQVEAVNKYVDTKKVTWTVQNTGNNDVFLRVKPLGSFYIDKGVNGENVDIEIVDYGWQKGKDGYYYYDKKLGIEETVEISLGISFDVWHTVEGLPVDIEVEAIQASNDAMASEWKYNPID
jgi:hypothetical protein